jgi:hypothetical protein
MTEERPSEPTPAPDDTTVTPPPSEPPASTPPTYTPPPVPPPAAQPTVAWAPPPAAGAAVGQRTTLALAAGILLVILGSLGVLFSLVVLTIGRGVIQGFDFSGIPGAEGFSDPNALVSGVITFLGIFVLACSTFYIVAGVGIMRSKNWGRVIGIVIGILAGLVWLGGITGGGRAAGGDTSFAVVLLAIHAYVVIALLFFWRSKSAA